MRLIVLMMGKNQTMHDDEILSELRAQRRAYAESFGNDLGKMFDALKAKEAALADRIVVGRPKLVSERLPLAPRTSSTDPD